MASLKDRFGQVARGESSLGFDPLANDEARLAVLNIEDIEPDPDQPRRDLGDLEGLKISIRAHGILQPLVVSPLDETRYRIIAGERRFTAAIQVGLRTVPALIRTAKDHHRLEIQLIENMHRKGLDPFEEAQGYERLIAEFNLTHELIAERVGKSRTHVTQMLSINRIPQDLWEQCKQTEVSRETLFLMAKQEEPERMNAILQAVRNGSSKDARREIARKGQPRAPKDGAPGRKPKRKYETQSEAIVIVQSLTETLTRDQIIAALREAAKQARKEEDEGESEPMSGA